MTSHSIRERQGPAGEAGFTLLEVLVVIAIGALGIALAAPYVRGPSPQAALTRTAQQLAQLLSGARTRAVAANLAQSCVIDVGARAVRSCAAGAPLVLPATVSFDVTASRSELVDGKVTRLTFYPDGSATGARIVMRAGGRSTVIDVDWLTGGVSTSTTGVR